MNEAEARGETPMEVGYPTEIFPQGFDEKLICNSCNKVLKDPVQSYCGHRFCKPCINREMRKSKTEGIQNQDKTGTKANKQKPPPHEKKRTPDMGMRPGAQKE
ncbi:hypothetical protein FSP39_001679 [Pinctada imbricata]|uniref:RING-type domain-containing protein n=1 Tax=Pinctada imbricata TaxID=66713 RepID=A0AA88XMM3_PINIB|nr:hypothetical protein FSP39_001679 [Pinctada imbricata]